jgi:hypothetical protein
VSRHEQKVSRERVKAFSQWTKCARRDDGCVQDLLTASRRKVADEDEEEEAVDHQEEEEEFDG